MDELLLSRVEDASLNASAPPQQRWLDGWLLRFSPGKAKRARCINAVALGRLPLSQKLRLAQDVFDEAGLPMVVRITRFSQPPDLDRLLTDVGYLRLDDTRVLVCVDRAESRTAPRPLPPGLSWMALDGAAYARTVGTLRASPPEQQEAHAERLVHSPVRYQGFAIRREADAAVLACGQFAREGDLVGLYDVFTHPQHRGQGLARLLCERLLSISANEGANVAYLQVEADNSHARHLYASLGFVPGYAYHYRQAP